MGMSPSVGINDSTSFDIQFNTESEIATLAKSVSGKSEHLNSMIHTALDARDSRTKILVDFAYPKFNTGKMPNDWKSYMGKMYKSLGDLGDLSDIAIEPMMIAIVVVNRKY